MKRDNKVTKYAIILLALTMIALILVSGTYAKYTSTATGADTAKIAKWSILVGDKEIAEKTAQTVTFGLFSEIKEADTTNAEDNVKSGKIIAPGTGGSINVEVKNKSEVDAQYTITYALTDENTAKVPLEFSVDGENWTSDITTLSITETLTKETGTSTATKKFYWRWAFENGTTPAEKDTRDTSDTALGIDAREGVAKDITVTATIVAEQVD